MRIRCRVCDKVSIFDRSCGRGDWSEVVRQGQGHLGSTSFCAKHCENVSKIYFSFKKKVYPVVLERKLQNYLISIFF